MPYLLFVALLHWLHPKANRNYRLNKRRCAYVGGRKQDQVQVAVRDYFLGAKAKFEPADGPVANCPVPGHIWLVAHYLQLFGNRGGNPTSSQIVLWQPFDYARYWSSICHESTAYCRAITGRITNWWGQWPFWRRVWGFKVTTPSVIRGVEVY